MAINIHAIVNSLTVEPNKRVSTNLYAARQKHIVFVKQLARFVLDVHFYENECPANTAYLNWEGVEGVTPYSDIYDADGSIINGLSFVCNGINYSFSNGNLVADTQGSTDFSSLPEAEELNGNEIIPVVQDGMNRRTTVKDIADSTLKAVKDDIDKAISDTVANGIYIDFATDKDIDDEVFNSSKS